MLGPHLYCTHAHHHHLRWASLIVIGTVYSTLPSEHTHLSTFDYFNGLILNASVFVCLRLASTSPLAGRKIGLCLSVLAKWEGRAELK